LNCLHILQYAIKRCFDWCEEVCRPRTVSAAEIELHAESYARCLTKCLKACREGAKEVVRDGAQD